MKNSLLKFFIFSFFLLSNVIMFAQPGDNDGGGGLEGNDPPAAPINTKLVWLALLGIIFAIYSFRKNKKTI